MLQTPYAPSNIASYIIEKMAAEGVKEKMVATILAGHSGWNLIVPADSPAQSVKDLAGKKIGITTKASTSDMAALWIAEQAGISMAQIPLGAGAVIPSLRSHQVDAIVFSALLTMRETLTGRARSLMDVGAVMPPTMANVYVASEVSNAVAVFSRNSTTGALTQLPDKSGCVSEGGSAGTCTDARAMSGQIESSGLLAVSRRDRRQEC